MSALNAHNDTYGYLSEFQVGSQLCVQTRENNVAALRIIALPGVGSKRFAYTYSVWP